MRKISVSLLLSLLVITSFAQSKKIDVDIVYKGGYNFYIANDLGRNGYYKQKTIAEIMGNKADSLGIEFVAAAGDVHHFNGIKSVNDPLWMTNYELIYSHPELMIDWFPILGNHEYRGNTQAVLDYTNVSRRWVMPGRYYVKKIDAENDKKHPHSSLNVYFIDTTPMADGYRDEPEKYPDVQTQDVNKQLTWLDNELKNSKADFNIVIGHHPIYVTEKKRSDDPSLMKLLDPILRKYNVSMYIAGHSHTFQHLKKEGSKVNYIVNASGSLGRQPLNGKDTQFSSSDEGFSVFSLGNGEIKLTFMNYLGNPIYQLKVAK